MPTFPLQWCAQRKTLAVDGVTRRTRPSVFGAKDYCIWRRGLDFVRVSIGIFSMTGLCKGKISISLPFVDCSRVSTGMTEMPGLCKVNIRITTMFVFEYLFTSIEIQELSKTPRGDGVQHCPLGEITVIFTPENKAKHKKWLSSATIKYAIVGFVRVSGLSNGIINMYGLWKSKYRYH